MLRRVAVPLFATAAVVGGCAADAKVVEVEYQLQVPDMIAYREGDGAWRTPRPGAYGYFLDVRDDFEVVAVFADPSTGAFAAEELAATADETDHWYVTTAGAAVYGETLPAFGETFDVCYPAAYPPQPGLVEVAGQVDQLGEITVGPDCERGFRAPWQFLLQLPPSTYDLIATSYTSLRIDRDVVIAGPTTLPEIDLATTGTPLDHATYVVVGTDPSGAIETDLSIATQSSYALVTVGKDTVSAMHTISAPSVPSSLLQPGDVQRLVVHSPGGFQAADSSATTYFPEQVSVLELLPIPTWEVDTSTGAVVASLPSPLDQRAQMFDLAVSADQPSSQQIVTATKDWLTARGASSLAFDTSAPGYDATWIPDLANGYQQTSDVRAVEGPVAYIAKQRTSAQFGTVPAVITSLASSR